MNLKNLNRVTEVLNFFNSMAALYQEVSCLNSTVVGSGGFEFLAGYTT